MFASAFSEVFVTTISQMAVLFIFIIIGFVLRKMELLKKDSIKVLSKLVSTVFLPCVLVNSFMTSFTIDSIKENSIIILISAIVVALTVVIGIFVGKLIVKDDEWLCKMYQYGLIYSNFAYMGIPIVQAISPDFADKYLIFTIVPQFVFTLWALPSLLIPKSNQTKSSISSYLKRLFNPIFICLLLGVILGLTGLGVWINDNVKFISSTISAGAACMSPIAMILTGVVIASYDVVKCFKDIKIYIISILRLIAIPALIGLLFILVRPAITLNDDILKCILVCILAYLAMPLGLNSVIIPSSFDKDVIDCAGMSLVSHILGIITIPVIFAIFLAL